MHPGALTPLGLNGSTVSLDSATIRRYDVEMDRTRVVRPDRSRGAVPAPAGSPSRHPVMQLQRVVGNRAVQLILSTAPRPVLQRMPYIVHAGYMSGDMFGISAALALDPGCGVVILTEGDAEIAKTREPDQGAFFETFYRAALANRGVRPDSVTRRVKRVTVNDAQAVYKDLLAGGETHGASVKAGARLEARDTFIGPGIATSIVGGKYEADDAAARAGVREAWTAGNGPTVGDLNTFLTSKGIQRGGKYALLWVRLSAKTKKGGAHAELDTSLQGVRDLKAQIIAQTGRTVIVVGDNPGKPEITNNAINLLEFWKQAPFNTLPDVEKRMAQLRLFSHMVQNGYDLVSIGMRSGAMEGPALLGVPTVYIEDEGNKQNIRMEKWLGKVPGWTQAKVEQLPTRTGRRYQRGSVPVSQLEQNLYDATRAVDRHTGEATTQTRLEHSYDPDVETFQKNFISASLRPWAKYLPRGVSKYEDFVTGYEKAGGAAWTATLRRLLTAWHGHHESWRNIEAELRAQETKIAPGAESDVRRTLGALRSANDKNLGLADFFREAGEALGLDDVPLRPALRKWRSVWTGKDTLVKGFIGEDLEKILSTPKLNQDRIDLRIARIAAELDPIVDAPAGTVGRVVAALRARKGVPTVAQFGGGLLSELRDHLAGRLGLGKTPQAAAVEPARAKYVTTADGKTWWSTLKPKVETLHGLIWPPTT